MSIDPNKIVTLDDLDEPAPIDQAEARVQAEMKELEGRAKESVGQGLQDKKIEREGRKLQEEAAQEIEQDRAEKSQS